MQLYKRKTNTTVSFMANIMVQNIDLKVKEVAIVVTVVPATLQSIVQLMEKFVTIVIKRDTSSLLVEAISVAIAIVVTVVPATLQSIVQLMEKFVTIVIKRDTSSLLVEAISVAILVPDGREGKVDPGRTNMKFHSVIKLMMAVGTHMSRTLFRLCTIKVFVEISLTFALMR